MMVDNARTVGGGGGTGGSTNGNYAGSGGTLEHAKGENGKGRSSGNLYAGAGGGGGGGPSGSGGHGRIGSGGSGGKGGRYSEYLNGPIGGGGHGGSGGANGSWHTTLPRSAARGNNGASGGDGQKGDIYSNDAPLVGGGGGGGGGAGGYGAVAKKNGTLNVLVVGGAGGQGGTGGDAALRAGYGGYGGGGGGGLSFSGGNLVVSGRAAAQGGAGGIGGRGGKVDGRVQGGGGGGNGGDGIDFTGQASATLTNAGKITAGAGGGGGGTGYSNGGNGGDGVHFAGNSAIVDNSGTIIGAAGGGPGAYSGNAGHDGAGISGANLTVHNSGMIAGGGKNGDAIIFSGSQNVLSLQSGSTLVGGLGVDGRLSLSGQADKTTLANDIHDAGGPGSIAYSGSKTLVLSGYNTYTGGTALGGGTLEVSGRFSLGSGAIAFSGVSSLPATLALDVNAWNVGGTFANTLIGFGESDRLDLNDFAYTSTLPQTVLKVSNGRLLVTGNNNSVTFKLGGAYAAAYYAQSDGRGGTLITEVPNSPPPMCFASGTRIRTAAGDVLVEALRVGDVAVTASGAQRPVIWIGHRAIRPANRTIPSDIRPVRVLACAFGAGRPERDLFLSPGHPVLVGADADGEGGFLVPIMCLINGTTIERVAVDEVTYWHVELDEHDILLAEGLPAESYLDCGDRTFFAEGSDHALANPDFVVPGLAGRCRAVATDGPMVEAERCRLDAVFAEGLAEACLWPGAWDAYLV